MKKIGHLDIDWIEFNKRLDAVEGVVKQPTVYNAPLKQETYNMNYKVDDHHYQAHIDNGTSIYTEYVSDNFVDMFPEDFWPTVGMDGRVIVKVLEHEPGIITQPHLDGYHNTKEAFDLADDGPVKRLWIPCTDYKFGHILCVGDDFIMTDYKAGDVFEIPGDVIHSAGNIGVETRRIITVTGEAIDKRGFRGVEVC